MNLSDAFPKEVIEPSGDSPALSPRSEGWKTVKKEVTLDPSGVALEKTWRIRSFGILKNAFLKELVKTAKMPSAYRRKGSDSAAWGQVQAKIMKRLDPKWRDWWSGKMQNRIQELRGELLKRQAIPVSLDKRLASYKYWKRTGMVPSVSISRVGKRTGTKVNVDVLPGSPGADIHRPMLWSPSRELVTSVHHGVGDVSQVAADPRSLLDRNYVIPGRTHAEVMGAYFGNPGVEFVGYGPRKLEVAAPLRAWLRTPEPFRQEAIFPRSSRHEAASVKTGSILKELKARKHGIPARMRMRISAMLRRLR